MIFLTVKDMTIERACKSSCQRDCLTLCGPSLRFRCCNWYIHTGFCFVRPQQWLVIIGWFWFSPRWREIFRHIVQQQALYLMVGSIFQSAVLFSWGGGGGEGEGEGEGERELGGRLANVVSGWGLHLLYVHEYIWGQWRLQWVCSINACHLGVWVWCVAACLTQAQLALYARDAQMLRVLIWLKETSSVHGIVLVQERARLL